MFRWTNYFYYVKLFFRFRHFLQCGSRNIGHCNISCFTKKTKHFWHLDLGWKQFSEILWKILTPREIDDVTAHQKKNVKMRKTFRRRRLFRSWSFSHTIKTGSRWKNMNTSSPSLQTWVTIWRWNFLKIFLSFRDSWTQNRDVQTDRHTYRQTVRQTPVLYCIDCMFTMWNKDL